MNKKDEIDGITTKQKETIEALNLELQQKLQTQQGRYNSILKNAKEYGDAFQSNIEKEELEHEKEIEKISKALAEEIANEKEITQKLQEENKKLTKENETSKAKDVEKQKEFEDLVIKNTTLLEDKVKICIGLLKMQEQLLEREQVVFSKDETIKNAKDEEINLENFRFMLDQKIKSLTSNKQKLVKEIDSREKILRDMFNELIKQSHSNNSIYLEIKTKLRKLDILNAQKKNTELKIYFWNSKIKEYHRKLSTALHSSAETSKICILINSILSESQKNDDDKMLSINTKSGTDQVSLITASASDVGMNVHEEQLNQNKWLIKKLYMINLASKNIREIREENIDTGLNQNKKLIEECNKQKEDNDYLVKKYKQYDKVIKEANRNNKRLLEEQMSKNNNMSQISGGNKPNLLKEINEKNAKLEEDIEGSGNIQIKDTSQANLNATEKLPKIPTSQKNIKSTPKDIVKKSEQSFPSLGKSKADEIVEK